MRWNYLINVISRRLFFWTGLFFLSGVWLVMLLTQAGAQTERSVADPQSVVEQGHMPWRIRFVEAAVVSGDNVRLGEVAVVVGDMPQAKWQELAQRELWPSPAEKSKPVNMTRPKLQEAVVKTMNDLAPYCLFPNSMALQRGGVVVGKAAIQDLVVKALTPAVSLLPGESVISDFRLPQYIFLKHAGQELEVVPQKNISPGRINLRIEAKEMDGKVLQKVTGSVFVDTWCEIPCATTTLNKDDVLEAHQVGFQRVNLAHLRSVPWDGRGGPWRLVRPVGVDQVIYQNDLAHIPTLRKGAYVNIVYEGANITLRVQGEALNDGAVGEMVPVRNLQSKKEIYAIVQDATTVVVK